MPATLPPNTRPRDISAVVPEHAHPSLIVMTVLTQLSVGAFVAIWLLQVFGATVGLGTAALVSLTVGGVALTAATLHLGRPIHAYRALRMWRRSWLSREVLLFGAFSKVAAAYAAMLWLELPGSAIVGAVTALLGAAGVIASACIYRVPSRPSWNTPYTLVEFALTAGILGALFVRAATVSESTWLVVAAAMLAAAQIVLQALRLFRCIASENLALRGTARLLSTVLASRLVARSVLLALGAIVVPLAALGPAEAILGPAKAGHYGALAWGAVFGSAEAGHYGAWGALACTLAAEVLGRYLFFVSVVPQHLAAPYLPAAREAA